MKKEIGETLPIPAGSHIKKKSQYLFSSTHNNGFRFKLNISKNLKAVREVQQWNQLSREVMGSLSLNEFKQPAENHTVKKDFKVMKFILLLDPSLSLIDALISTLTQNRCCAQSQWVLANLRFYNFLNAEKQDDNQGL